MIDREHDLPITRQAEVLRISRGSVYYLPRPVPEADLAIMRRLDRQHLEFPFAGARMLRGMLAAEGCKIGRRHVKTLMRRMGIEALYRRPRTTKPEPGHKVYPYLLRAVEITRPNQVLRQPFGVVTVVHAMRTSSSAASPLQMFAVMRPIMTQLAKTTSMYWTRMAFPTPCSCSRAFSERTTIISDALRRYPRFRGIAVVQPTIRSDELRALDEAGVVGIRST
jgi:hypothetical protein